MFKEELADLLKKYRIMYDSKIPDYDDLAQYLTGCLYKYRIKGGDQWTDIKDEMPEEGMTVIGYDELYCDIGEAEFCSCLNALIFVGSRGDDCNITHWMPFPTPPKKLERITKNERNS